MGENHSNKFEYSMDCNNTTSPSQLQEVTLDPDATNFSYFGMRSPGAMTSGRSVKEIDEQLTNLRKENFNLKLRIYFLEERMGSNFNSDNENAIKKNIELMVELENVRKDLEDKQELLCQAAKAMEIEEEEKKKEILVRDEEIAGLKEVVVEVQKQLQVEMQARERKDLDLCAQAFDLDVRENNTADVVNQLQATIQTLQDELKKERERADHFESIMELAESAHVRCKALETEVEQRESRLNVLTCELEETGGKISSYNWHIKSLQEDLDEKTARLKNTLVELSQKDQDLKEHQSQIKEISKVCSSAQQEKEKHERRVDKYKSMLSQSEIKNSEMQAFVDNLKSKTHNLEVKLESALDEVKRLKAAGVISTGQQCEASNTDSNLFSVRKTVHETAKSLSAKNLPKQLNQSPRSVHSISPAKSLASVVSRSASDSLEMGEFSPHRAAAISEIRSSSQMEINGEAQLSQEELLELKKNHYKACKMIKVMIQKKNEYLGQINKLQAQLVEQNTEIESLQGKIGELIDCGGVDQRRTKKKSIQEMVSDLKLTASSNPAANKETSMAGDGTHLAEEYKELAGELERKIEVLSETMNEKDHQLEHLKLDLQAKANRIIDLEFELLTLNQGVRSVEPQDQSVERLLQNKLEQESEIKRLDGELRKRTCDLQGIVNKELWEKNRSIEKMQNVLKAKDQEIGKLEKSMHGKEMQLKILKDKINELGIHVNLPPGLVAANGSFGVDSGGDATSLQDQLRVCLEERKHFVQEICDLQLKLKNTPEHDENRQILQMKTEYKDLREQLEKSEKLRHEGQEICSVLSTRLEELCYFLDTLLKHKAVLGFLGCEQMRRLRQTIDKSLDFSRTLSATMSLNPDQSLLQLSNISNLLNSTRNDNMAFGDFFAQDEENNAVLSIVPSDITLTYQSHLNRSTGLGNEQGEVINVLRSQVANLKREIELRDIELGKRLVASEAEKPLENDEEFVDAVVDLQQASIQVSSPDTVLLNLVEDASRLNATSSTLVADKSNKNHTNDNQSESESWSEPDRTVSLARMGLQDESLKRSSSGRRARFAGESELSTESTEEVHGSARTPSKRTTLAETRQTVISLHEQVCELELKLKEKENQLLAAQVAFYETDNTLKREQEKLAEARRSNSQLTTEVNDALKKLEDADREKQRMEHELKSIKEEHLRILFQITAANRKLDDAEAQKSESERKITELDEIVTVLEEFRRNVDARLESKDKEMQNAVNQMQVEKTRAQAAAKNAEVLLEKAKSDMQAVEAELQGMHRREQEIRGELEEMFNAKLKRAEEQFVTNLKGIEQDYEERANSCRVAVMQMKETYEKDYIKKSEVDKRTMEVKEITREVENLKDVIQECENKMRVMAEREVELQNRVLDAQREHHDKLYGLQKELDNATLQYSEAILEKTRLKNETSSLEQNIQKFYSKEIELIKEVKGLQKDFENTQSTLENQVSQLEHQKSLLELKVGDLKTVNAELQSANAELRNRLVKIQTSRSFDTSVTASLPNNPGTMITDPHAVKTLPMPIQTFGQYARQLSSDHSGYTSEDIPVDDCISKAVSFAYPNLQNLLVGDMDNERVNANSSPDLGIESDHGRFSSLEANVSIPRPLLPTLELTESMSNLLDPVHDESCANDQCCKKTKLMATENVELRKRLLRTRRALEETLNRLTMANRQKKEVEKSICKQIHKTSQVLRKAKANLDSGSETDLLKQ